VVITCDRCQEAFDEKDRVPTILPDCAHTICSLCIYDIIDNTPDHCCPICNQEIVDISKPELFKANFKLLSILSMTNQTGQSIVQVIACERHPDKSIEYFCKQCSQAVCATCMYDEHNGHHMVPVKEMGNTVKQNITDLSKMIMNTRRLTEDNLNLLE
jgi:hypothetical protein